jgi:hypothetical protein
MMKKNVYTIVFFLWALPSFIYAQNLAGMYEREKDFMDNPTVIILKSDGNFEISTGGTSVRGTYTVSEGKVNFTDQTGDYPDTMAGLGAYTIDLNGAKLSFKPIKDKAIQRKDVLTGANWRKIKD